MAKERGKNNGDKCEADLMPTIDKRGKHGILIAEGENMNKSQFMHMELYSRTGFKSDGKQVRTSSGAVIAEATRVDGFTSHIGKPKPPAYLYSTGKSLEVEYEDALKQLEGERDSLGRKIKSDQNILLAGVVSYPKPIKADWTEDDKDNYELFKTASIEFLQNEYGGNLVAVLEHTDEEYPHLHFYAVNRDKIADAWKLHPGERARKEAEGGRSEKTKAYRQVMSSLQDRFWQAVGVYCGLDRLGPKAQRMSRAEWKERKRATKMLATAVKKLKEEVKANSKNSQRLEEAMTELELRLADVAKSEAQVEFERKQVQLAKEQLELLEWVKKNKPEIVSEFRIQKIKAKASHSLGSSKGIKI